jgi:MFS family permease
MMSATVIVVIGAALCAGAKGAHGSLPGMFAALAVYRALLGIGVGAEYPAGSVAAGEASEESKAGTRHLLFVMVRKLWASCMIVLDS